MLDEITWNGHIGSVPVNIHRANMMWYNPTLMKKAGITLPITSMRARLADMAKLKAKGITPLALDNRTRGWPERGLSEDGPWFPRQRLVHQPEVGVAAIAIPALWQMCGYIMALYLAALRGVPEGRRLP